MKIYPSEYGLQKFSHLPKEVILDMVKDIIEMKDFSKNDAIGTLLYLKNESGKNSYVTNTCDEIFEKASENDND